MNRNQMLGRIGSQRTIWDLVVIGGGATGLGTAVEAASRGYTTLLMEQHDFAKGTSSRSTKLIHGGVRYLQQGNISLVLEALQERGLLMHNAPHLVRHQSFVVPNYDWWEGPFYGIGLKVYDVLAGKLGLGPSRLLSREEVLEYIPTIEPEGLRGGVIYFDGQFDDARLAVNLARTAADLGATVLNYVSVTGLLKSKGMVQGVCALDTLSNQQYEIRARAVVNATGVFTDAILKMDDVTAEAIIAPSQGVHLVLDQSFLPGKSAIMVPHTDDGRVLFAVPWHRRVLVGTTDTAIERPALEPVALEEEIEFILKHAAKYLTKDPQRRDVLSVFAGLRPLVRSVDNKSTAALSRDHTVLVSQSGLISIAGGKWTIYRKMAEDAVDHAAAVACLERRQSVTSDLQIHGWVKVSDASDPLQFYGSDAAHIRSIADSDEELRQPLHPRLPYMKAEVVWAARHEMACSVEDIQARRTRALLLDARASIEAAADVAELLAAELKKDSKWTAQQVKEYRQVARNYVLA